MGQHMRFKGEQTGYEWAMGPWDSMPGTTAPSPLQGGQPAMDRAGRRGTTDPVLAHDPMTGQPGFSRELTNVPLRGGDRIFVLKYLFSIFDPQRFDAVVFKNPRDPGINYIKRLIGLPGEQIAIVDGDVFVRRPVVGEAPTADPWERDDWTIERKPERNQRALWMPIFDSRFTPLNTSRDGRRVFASPWLADGAATSASADWQIDGRADYRFDSSRATSLVWDQQRWPILDSYPYNRLPDRPGVPVNGAFGVADVRLSLGVRPDAPGLEVSGIVRARGHEFRATISGREVTLALRPTPPTPGSPQPEAAAAWTTLATVTLPRELAPGRVANLEFWHVDQTLQLWIDGERVAKADYEWSPAQRLLNTTGLSLEQVMSGPPTLLALRERYPSPGARFEFKGSAFTLYRVALDRDVFYQPGVYPLTNDAGLPHSSSGMPSAATHPRSTLTLGPDQFFVCGDNSPQSLDGRLWDLPEPWVATIDPNIAVVNRDLLIGRAFFVYFPAMHRQYRVPVPDFGRMRWIW
jgi:signal peptidase I